MQGWKQCVLEVNKSMLDAVKIIDATPARIALVVDNDMRLMGTITDYDVRHAILDGIGMQVPVTDIMNSSPKFLSEELDNEVMLSTMREMNIKQLPILDADGKLTDLKLMQELGDIKKRTNPVLIMAGGLGSRLRPLTDNCPKPLLKIGAKPILQIILENFIDEGFTEFYFSVNYKSEMIKEYFGDGSKFRVNISYLEEKKRLGTAGAISLLPKNISEPLIVMNGDLLTKVDFKQLLDFHYNRYGQATMCVREYSYQVPYGVVKFDGWKITQLQEKPLHTEFVNAGIYVISPEVLRRVPHDKFFDMTDLFNELIAENMKALIFPIREYWLDIGRMEDFMRAQEEFL